MRRVARDPGGWVQGLARSAGLALALLAGWTGSSPAFETAAPTAILTDFATGTILFEKNADAPVPPASLVKLMTIAVVFNELKAGRLKLEDRFTVSEYAWRTGGASSGGSTMFLPLHSEVTVEDLVKGILIQSGNDATIVVAEGIAGSVEAFAAMMNARAKELGLTTSRFANPHGLPDPGQRVSMRDLSILAGHLIRDYPDYYHWFSEEEFTFNGITQRSRNPLLGLGADGLKTGHTAEAGYGLVASAEENGRRIVLAMTGMKSVKERAEEAKRMMDWGLRSFGEIVLLPAGGTAGEAVVSGGAEPGVAMVAAADIRVLSARGSEGEFSTAVLAGPPVPAPLAKGDRVGTLQVLKAGTVIAEAPLVAAGPVDEASLLWWMWDSVISTVW